MAIFGFIGIGNMGYAMLTGAMKYFNKEEFVYTDVNELRLEKVQEDTAISYVKNDKECVRNCKYIILAVKPQFYHVVLSNIKDVLTHEHILISIAPGISIDSIKKQVGENVRVIRLMPNTPAMVLEAMTVGVYSDDVYTKEEKTVFEKFINSFGKFELITENLMDAVVAANGSSPAFVYMFIEAMSDGVVKYGISREQATRLVAQTVLGSAKMVLETGIHPEQLKDMVCSPAGTTIQGVSALEEHGFRNALIKAVDAVYNKSIEIGKK